MKRVLIALAVFLFPLIIFAGGPSGRQHWVCSQPGTLEDNYAYAVSHSFEARPNGYDAKEEAFEDHLQKVTDGIFDPVYDAVCRDFTTIEKAEEYLKKMLIKVEKRKFMILWVNFKHQGN